MNEAVIILAGPEEGFFPQEKSLLQQINHDYHPLTLNWKLNSLMATNSKEFYERKKIGLLCIYTILDSLNNEFDIIYYKFKKQKY